QEPLDPFSYERLGTWEGCAVENDFLSVPVERVDGSAGILAVDLSVSPVRVDWESYVGYSEMSFSDLRWDRPREPVLVRVVARLGDYHAHDFPVRKDHYCFKLTNPEGDDHLWAYLSSVGQGHPDLYLAFQADQFPLLTLRVAYPPHSTQADQVEIKEVVGIGWALREPEAASEASGSEDEVVGALREG
ncbi:MAG: hypothetical protein AAF514_01235, partial [Verrucomicrobiota bacterium]